jgi:P-type Cu2+ transporter
MDHHAARFRDRFWLSLALSVPVVAYSGMVQDRWAFLQGGLAEARARQPGMMLLISLAILVGFGASAASALGLFHLEFWWELALLIVVMLLGHWLEMRASTRPRGP